MFFRRSFFIVLFALLLLFGLFGLRQQSNFDQGYSEGYAAAQQVNSTESGEPAAETSGNDGNPAEAAERHPYRRGWGYFSILGFFGFFLKLWLMFIIFGFFMRMLGFGRCRTRHRRHWGHWSKWGNSPYEKQPDDVEPDIRHA